MRTTDVEALPTEKQDCVLLYSISHRNKLLRYIQENSTLFITPTLILLLRYQMPTFSQSIISVLFCWISRINSAPIECVRPSERRTILDGLTCAPVCRSWHLHPRPPPIRKVTGHQIQQSKAVRKGCLPVPWMGLWGTKPGDAFHLLGDHMLGEVIMPGQAYQEEG